MVPRVPEPRTIMDPPSLETLEGACVKKPLPVVLEQGRPSPQRRSTVPESPTEPTRIPTSTFTLPSYPRNRSPFTRTHVRSRSSNSSLSAPLMARAHSSPVPDNKNRPYPSTARPSSPLGPPGRHRSPLRKTTDEPFSSFSNHLPIGETISENHELDLTPRAAGSNSPTDGSNIPSSPVPSIHNTFPRARRRPSSPFYPSSSQTVYLNTATPATTTTSIPLRTSTSSPSLDFTTTTTTTYNEPFPSSSSSFSSSIPSTPTSFRSRSPSISSLETIEDTPDAELEAEHIAQLKAAADREEAAAKKESEEEGGMGGVRRRGLGGRSDKRKRWSVCGAERRGDLDLETIWED
ncbi:MAG: hypothetical protein LQ343_002025 [Gyalolechia ehrenbergii]|nr:MAG: hypothetical protein LQ343_002025 [Gyalolechia ehrenbergii]